jgi:hypothetical protein
MELVINGVVFFRACGNVEEEEMVKKRNELERVRRIASEIAEEVEGGKHELELRRRAFDLEAAHVEAFGVQVWLKLWQMFVDHVSK